MPILVQLQSETGTPIDEVNDVQNVVPYLISKRDDSSFPMLRFIDPYGDTVFNCLQLKLVAEELNRLLTHADTTEEKTALKQILNLAVKGRDEIHLYLKFIGD